MLLRAVRLGGIFKHQQVMLFCQRQDLAHWRKLTIEMNRDHRAGAGRDMGLYSGTRQVIGVRIGLDKYRRKIVAADRQYRSNEGIRRNNHLVAISQFACRFPCA